MVGIIGEGQDVPVPREHIRWISELLDPQFARSGYTITVFRDDDRRRAGKYFRRRPLHADNMIRSQEKDNGVCQWLDVTD